MKKNIALTAFLFLSDIFAFVLLTNLIEDFFPFILPHMITEYRNKNENR